MTASYCARRRLRILRQVVGGAAGHLLDIGCGDGTFLLAARTAGWSVVGTEMNTAPARQAGLAVYPNISDMHSRAPFDAITLWHTFEHLAGPRAMLEDIRRLLSANGAQIIAVPNAGGLQARIFGPQWFHLDVPRHLCHFTRSSLANLLQSEGFLPSREWHQEFEYDLLGWSQSALNLLAPGRPNLFFDLLRGFQPPIGKLASAAAWLATVLSVSSMYTGNDLHHGPPERPDARQGRATSDKGVKVALLFVFFHRRLCGPLANSLFHHRLHSKARPKVPPKSHSKPLITKPMTPFKKLSIS